MNKGNNGLTSSLYSKLKMLVVGDEDMNDREDELDKEDAQKGSEESQAERNQRGKFVKDLIEVMQKQDNSADSEGLGLLQDFEKPKRFFSFFPGEDVDGKEMAMAQALRYEDETKLRASIILDAYKDQMLSVGT